MAMGSSLSAGSISSTLRSQNGIFTCGFHNISLNSSTFSIWFSNASEGSQRTVVWTAQSGRPVYAWGSKVELSFDGRMVLRDNDGQTVWTNDVSPSNAEAKHAHLSDSGNLIVKGKGDVVLWQSFASPTDTLLPNQNITYTMKKLESSNGLLVRGHYSLHFDDQLLISLFDDQKGHSFIYWPNPDLNIWDKRRIPNIGTSGYLNSLGQFYGSDNTSFEASDKGFRTIRRLTLDYDGNLRLYSLKDDGKWSVTWMAFPQLCRVHGLCGHNGICVYSPVPSCACAPGFDVIDPSDWGKGCRPTFKQTCEKQNVTFLQLPNTDFRGLDLSAHHFVSFGHCKKICLTDCNCNGFEYWQGTGDCFPKAILLGGTSLQQNTGNTYIKIPKGLKVSKPLIPRSQFFGHKRWHGCSEANEYIIANITAKDETSQNKLMYLFLVYGFLSAIFVAELVFIVLGWFILRREGKQLRGAWPAEAGYEMITNHFRRYTYSELVTATRKFKDELGRGASGIVYKGILKDSRAVAVKKFEDINQDGEEFQHELSVIGRIYHMNLVRVWGFCSDGPHRILISEYLENGSLDKMLFGVECSEILLKWKQRFNIALGVARGLAYLHHECLEWVIHCDVKPENILLDENLVPKVADFGLAKLLNRGSSNVNVSRIQGTRGYLAPEWVSSLPITAKVDIYSFGVVLLELLKGARISDMENKEDEEVEMVLGRIVRMLKENLQLDGTGQYWIPDFIDARLNGEFNYMQAITMTKLAVSCLEEDRSRRPTMENVVEMLVSVDEVTGATRVGGAV
ncbi:hypothetical protein BS78_K305900 [Paspalum vaginatum]|uniref:Receptor-like serine/threonine-protein kinase n=1 Tax=Paspalum vaginatum TaxID=158149 RepID=A0A9W7XCV8_9POAL|nr:hypothetical protein BS78_K305900 [Paspalum vaginatum]